MNFPHFFRQFFLLLTLFPFATLSAQLKATWTRGGIEITFDAPQRGILEDLYLEIPTAVAADWDGITVDVIGRGAVLLPQLATMSQGNHGGAYLRKQVGRAFLRHEGKISMIYLQDIDLRPDNGGDLVFFLPQAKGNRQTLQNIRARWRMSTPYLPESHRGGRYVQHDEQWRQSACSVYTLPEVKRTTHAARALGLKGDGKTDDTKALNEAIERLHREGGGTIHFESGTYCLRSVHLLSHVWLHLDREAVLQGIPGMDDPEETWFANYDPHAGDVRQDKRIYDAWDNYMLKQDFGHSFFQNAMFWAVRQHDIRITGSGRITGNGVLDTSSDVMRHPSGRRVDKMFSFKLCRDIEIGGEIPEGADLWYDPQTDDVFYLDGTPLDGQLKIDQGGHFVLLATGTDSLRVHDIYAGKHSLDFARDIFDFMACNEVSVRNIYSRANGDDIVKLGSDCSLGFTRKSRGVSARNIIGDTGCNLFQIGSETADDIEEVFVDNIYVLGTNKAGFSISCNDGGTVRGVWLNSGRTGKLHSRSQMHRTRCPFFLSISNRGRVCGSQVAEYIFEEHGKERRELLVTNHRIGSIEDIHLSGVDCDEVYAGSSYRQKRWAPYDGKQPEATPIFSGYKVPSYVDFTLPDGRMTGYIRNLTLQDIHILVKGNHPAKDSLSVCPEMQLGKFNIRDLGTQPSYGLWMRHVDGLSIQGVVLRSELPDGRPAVRLEDVKRVSRLDYTAGPLSAGAAEKAQ